MEYLIGGLAAIAITVVVVDRLLRDRPASRTTGRAAPVESTGARDAEVRSQPGVSPALESIAVLPFVNVSEDPGNEYFADGLSEELLNLLARVPELRVAARTSAFRFKGEKVDVQDVAAKLNVEHVLEGSVRKSGNVVRITARLVKAADGYQLWSESYERSLDDIFAVQDEIATSVVNALHVQLLGRELGPGAKPRDPEVYNLVLQGRFIGERRGREDVERAVRYYRQALALDPGYAPAWAGLARTHQNLADSGWLPIDEGYRRALEEAQRALTLDPNQVDAHIAIGIYHLNYDWNWQAADAAFRRVLDLEPGGLRAVTSAAALDMTLGRWDGAIAGFRKAIELDPLRPNSYSSLAFSLSAVGRYDESEAALRKAMELDPEGSYRHYALGRLLLLKGQPEAALEQMRLEKEETFRAIGLPLVYHALGMEAESEAALAELKARYADGAAYQIAQVHAYRGELDAAFEWLERAYAQRDSGLAEIKDDPINRALEADPRYADFLRKLRLPPQTWRERRDPGAGSGSTA
jgi:TolB-like protein/Tfp pilus assembly protein PilF